MFKQLIFVVIVCVTLVLVGVQPVLASDDSGRIRLGGFVGMATSEHEDLNETIDDLESFWKNWDVDWQEDDLAGGLFFGGSAEYLVNENWVIGTEFLRLSSSGGYDWSLNDLVVTDVDVGYDTGGNLVSVYGVYRLPLGDSPAALRLGAGVGYLFGAKFEQDFHADQEWERRIESGRDTEVIQSNLEATGSTIAFHGLVGAEYELTDALLLSANIAYRVASVDELEVDSISTTVNGAPVDTFWDIEEGETLKWYDDNGVYFSTEEGDKVGLDFGGLYFTLSIAYAF